MKAIFKGKILENHIVDYCITGGVREQVLIDDLKLKTVVTKWEDIAIRNLEDIRINIHEQDNIFLENIGEVKIEKILPELNGNVIYCTNYIIKRFKENY